MKYKPKEIYCPQCNRKIGIYDGRSTIDHIMTCRKCKKKVIYHVQSGEVESKSMPQRNCSSGMTFY